MTDQYDGPILLLQEADKEFHDIYGLDWLVVYLTSFPVGVRVFKDSGSDLLYEEDSSLTEEDAWEKRNDLLHRLQKIYPCEDAELKRDFFKLQTYEEREQTKKYVRRLLNHKGENNDH